MDVGLVAIFVALGAAVGFLAGLLGIGGGMTIVPVLVAAFTHVGFPLQHILPMAIGTAMATIVFTSLSSARAHHAHGAVGWRIVRAMAPGLVLGSLLGPQFAAAIPARLMGAIFALFTWFTAARMVRAPAAAKAARTLPGSAAMFGVGTGIGAIAGMLGAGGAFLTVPFMTRCNVPIHGAVATAAALGIPIALAATIGFVVAGLAQEGLPAWSVGYVHLPALAAIVGASMLAAPYGARTAHRWPVAKLRRAFAVLMAALGAYMAWWSLVR
jgi:uncharacterized membrane protein YfcA